MKPTSEILRRLKENSRYISRKSVNGKPCALRGASTVWRGDYTNQYSETIQGGVFLPYHWTGHASRLNREASSDMRSESYAKEELVAEITSMFVSAETGIPQTQEHFDNHAAYVDYWVKAVKEDPNALFRAVNQAQKASDEILKYERVREREQAQSQITTEVASPEQNPALTEQIIRDMRLIEGDTKVYLKPRVDGQQYKGKIVHVDESQGYCVQQIGRQSLVVHRLERMSEVPPLGEAVKISYDTGEEKAKISIQEDRHHGLRR